MGRPLLPCVSPRTEARWYLSLVIRRLRVHEGLQRQHVGRRRQSTFDSTYVMHRPAPRSPYPDATRASVPDSLGSASKATARRLAALVAVVAAAGCGDDAPSGPERLVETVEVVPATAWLEVGQTLPLQFVAREMDGGPVIGVSAKWQTSAAARATVSNAGVVTAVADGAARITATLGNREAFSDVQVVAPVKPVNSWGLDQQGITEVPLLAVWAASPTLVFAGGQDGVILRWTGGTWAAMPTPTQETIVGIWGTSETNVFAIGSGGVILRFDGSTWTPMESGTTTTLLEVWGLDETHVYATGASGVMLRYDGSRWSTMTNTGPTEIWGIWAKSGDSDLDHVFAVGSRAMSLGDTATAFKIFDAIVHKAPNFDEGWNKRATVYYMMGNYEA